MKRVALYVRVSTGDQNPGAQLLELQKYVAARGLDSPIVYEDIATGTNTNRPALKRLMLDARRRKFDVLVVYKLDRFARSLKDLVNMLQELSDLEVGFVALSDQINLGTASGRLMVHLIGAFAEFEASLIRERVKSGLANAKSKGVKLGRPKLRNDKEIKALKALGLSFRQIAKELNTSVASVQRALSVSKP